MQGQAAVDFTVTVGITSQFQEAINVLTGSTGYQGIDGYVCDKIVHPFTVTYELPFSPVRRMHIFFIIKK